MDKKQNKTKQNSLRLLDIQVSNTGNRTIYDCRNTVVAKKGDSLVYNHLSRHSRHALFFFFCCSLFELENTAEGSAIFQFQFKGEVRMCLQILKAFYKGYEEDIETKVSVTSLKWVIN